MASSNPLRDTRPTEPLYAHEPLVAWDRFIRLLRIHHDPTTNIVSFSLIPIPCIPSTPPVQPYEAISWMWDPPEHRKTSTLTIDGANLGISTNMHGILKQLIPPPSSLSRTSTSPTSPERFVWIDSICIDQTDRDEDDGDEVQVEKDVQIRLMTKVYNDATRVLAFPPPFEVGPEPTHLPYAAEFVDWLSVYLLVAKFLPAAMGSHHGQQHFIGLEGDLPLERDGWLAFLGLVSSPFWQRAWIIQEIVVGKSVTVRYGGREIDFAVLGNVMMAFKRVDTATQMPYLTVGGWVGAERMAKFRTGIDLVVRLHGFRELYAAGQMPTVPDILVECVQSRATYSCDKVWALGGIGAGMDLTELGLTKQKARDDRKLFTAVTRLVLERAPRGARYLLLAMAGKNNQSERCADWPSWVPDLNALPKLHPLGHGLSPYTAGYGFPADIIPDAGESSIIISGIAIGVLEYVDDNNPYIALGGGRIDNAQMELFNRILLRAEMDDEMRDFFYLNLAWFRTLREETFALYGNLGRPNDSTYPMAPGQSLIEAILRTIIADHDVGFPASSNTLATICVWFVYLQIRVSRENPNQTEASKKWLASLVRETLTLRLKDSGVDVEDTTAQGQQRMQEVCAGLEAALSDEIREFAEGTAAGDGRMRRCTQLTRNIIARRAAGKKFALSELGFMLLVPEGAKEGDVIVIFGEARVPFLLRPCGDRDAKLVGEAYMHGFGQGDLLGKYTAERGRLELFKIR